MRSGDPRAPHFIFGTHEQFFGTPEQDGGCLITYLHIESSTLPPQSTLGWPGASQHSFTTQTTLSEGLTHVSVFDGRTGCLGSVRFELPVSILSLGIYPRPHRTTGHITYHCEVRVLFPCALPNPLGAKGNRLG
jgi:hypothetical protein